MACEEVREGESAGSPGVRWAPGVGANGGMRRGLPFPSLFDCGWSLLIHGVADTKRLNLGNPNPIYERELTKLDVHQEEGRWNVSKDGVGRRECRHK